MAHRIAAAAVGVLLLCLSVPLKAADDPNVEMMKKLFTKIANSVGVGSANDPIVGRSYLVLANPGVLIDPTLDVNKPGDYYRLSRTLDRVLAPTWIYRPTSERTLDVYQTILDYHEAPIIKPNAEQQKLLDDARRRIFSDVKARTYSQQYEKFRSTRRTLATATKAVEDYVRANPNEGVPATLLNDLQDATADYNLLGSKNEMIGAEAVIDTYEHLDPNVWWGGLRTQFLNQTRTFNNTRFATYDFYPTYPQWHDRSREWTKITLSQKDLEQTANSSHTSVSGGFGVDFGLFSVGADYANEQNRTYFKLDVSEYTVSMELTTVLLDRPWMNAAVFQSNAWRWLSSTPYSGRLVSDGTHPGAGQPSAGVMPYLPTALLLARNVSVTGKFNGDLKTTFDSRTSGGASLGWGMFSFGGRTNSSDANSYIKGNATGTTLSFAAPQILGFFVDVLPKNPNPDSKYTWPDPIKGLTKLQIEQSDALISQAQKLLDRLQK